MEMDFSIIIPLFNEEESLRELVSKIKSAFSKVKKSYEIIFVDDGSTDNSLEVLKMIERDNKDARVFSFRKNLGKSPALMLGFQEANGKYIVAVIGAGPAGLFAAKNLANQGVHVELSRHSHTAVETAREAFAYLTRAMKE